jgi:hypothetical protein
VSKTKQNDVIIVDQCDCYGCFDDEKYTPRGVPAVEDRWSTECMNILFIVIAVVSVVLLFTGGFVASIHWLLWIGVVLLIIAIIAFLIRALSGRSRV